MASRLKPKPFTELTPQQQEQYERIKRARPPRADGQFGGPFDPWIRSPEVAQRAMSLGNYIWERTLNAFNIPTGENDPSPLPRSE
jgi:hypothetical protein